MRPALFVAIYLMFLSPLSGQESLDRIDLVLLDGHTTNAVPYAHISQENKLVAISNYFGQAELLPSNRTYTVTCVGYKELKFKVERLRKDRIKVIQLEPDQRILDAITITPTSLVDMITSVYENIPSAYQDKPHLLKGVLEERYMDTLGHANITSKAEIQVQKKSYANKNSKGEVKIDSMAREYDVMSTPYTQIYAGAHIPHRFDFVMKREDFINPVSFNKYQYTYLGEWESEGRKLDMIGFEPKSEGLLGGQFRGKMYLDLKEKVFVRAEYQYAKSGFLNNAASRWADQRMFITAYRPDSTGWYFAYTWDEAVRHEDNFLLSQCFKTTSIEYDTLVDWAYDEKIHFQSMVEQAEADSLVVINKGNMKFIESPKVEYRRLQMIRKVLMKLEIGIGLKLYTLNAADFHGSSTLTYEGENLSLDECFSLASVDVGLFGMFRYPLLDNLFLKFAQSESFVGRIKNKHWDLDLNYRLLFKSVRPTYLNFSLGYSEFVTDFRFEKQAGIQPYFQNKYVGIIGGLNYEIRLNPKWKLGVGYSYFQPIENQEKLYLKEKYGLFNLFSKKHDYPPDLMTWEVNNEIQTSTLNTFNNHSFDISLILSFE